MVRQQDLLELHYNKLVNQVTVPTDVPEGKDALKSIMCETPLSAIFFGAKNITLLNYAIRYTVYKETGKVVSDQSKYDLLIVMRSLYLQYTDNGDISQIASLNKMVLDYCVQTVITAMYQHIQYMSEIGKNPLPMDRSKSAFNSTRTETQGRKVAV